MNRTDSLKLMKALQPFLQGAVIAPKEAQKIVNDYLKGSVEELKKLVFSPEIPMMYNSCVEELSKFLN